MPVRHNAQESRNSATPAPWKRLENSIREKDKTKALGLLAIYHLMKGKTPKEVADSSKWTSQRSTGSSKGGTKRGWRG